MTLQEVIKSWRKHARDLRNKRGKDPRDGGMDEYEWNMQANLIDQILNDIEGAVE